MAQEKWEIQYKWGGYPEIKVCTVNTRREFDENMAYIRKHDNSYTLVCAKYFNGKEWIVVQDTRYDKTEF